MRTSRGAALIISLWTLTLLSLLALGLGYRTRLEAQLTRYQVESIGLLQLAKAGVVLSRPAVAASTGYSALNQPWSHDPEAFVEREVLGGSLDWSHEAAGPDGEPRALAGLSDEESRLSLNAASLETLFHVPGLDEELAAAILDWRDPDEEPREGGAERSEGYEPRDGPFRSVDELLLVHGMTPERFERAAPFLTAHGSGKVNVNTAPREVLLALGLEPEVASKLLEFRAGEDLAVGTEDDGVFKSAASIVQELSKSKGLGPSELGNLSKVLSSLAVDSTFFRAELTARRGRLSRRYVVVLGRGAAEPSYWHEGT